MSEIRYTTAPYAYDDLRRRLVKRLVGMDDPDGHWLWQGGRYGNGYGEIWLRSKLIGAHVAAYLTLVGPVPHGLYVCHHCDTKLCCNPRHLFLGTNSDNQQDAKAKGIPTGRPKLTECQRGHALEGDNVVLKPRGDGSLKRICRECNRGRNRRYYAKGKGV